MDGAETGGTDEVGAAPLLIRRAWYRRVLRSLAKTFAFVLVSLTMLAVPYNAYTAGRARLTQLAGLCLSKAVTFGAEDSMFPAGAPYSVAARIGAPAPAIVPGAHHLSLISHPAAVAASVEALVARAAEPCTSRGV